VGLVLAIALGWLRGLARPWMMTAGLLTYPLYLAHQYIGFVLFDRFRHVERAVLLVGVIAVVTAIAWLVHCVIERPLAPKLRAAIDALGKNGVRSRRSWARVTGPP
jgi:peptidoglycan/LPS O-acetylase OafA/YrhL